MNSAEKSNSMVNLRLALGIMLLVVGFLSPLAGVLVLRTSWPVAVKSALAGCLFFGFEILAFPAIAVMGKANFDRIMALIWRVLGRLQPTARDIGRLRHAIGLVLLLLPLVPIYLTAYLPSWLPADPGWRLAINLLADAVFLISLFVLGGDFWDKLRALFMRRARAQFPTDRP